MKILLTWWLLLPIKQVIHFKIFHKEWPQTIIESIEDFGLSKKKKSSKLFSKIGIVGGGNDGQYIARVCSSYGIEVVFNELNQEKIQETFDKIGEMIDNRIKNWGATEGDKKAIYRVFKEQPT